MSTVDFYSSSRQFRRALKSDWRLHSVELLCGILYAVVGFYVGHRVGLSQVYSVITPFLITAGFVVYLTRRLCLPEVKRSSAACYLNLPQGRLMALDAHVAFLVMAVLWLNAWVFVGSLLKLGGGGMTACYRIHPDFSALPWLVMALTIRHVYLKHTPAFWCRSVVWYVVLLSGIVWKFWHCHQPAHAANHYWPDRGMSLPMEWAIVAIMAAVAMWMIHRTRIQWRNRQIGEIR